MAERRNPGKEHIQAERRGKKSLVKSIVGMGAMMLGWGIGLKVSKGIGHLVNRKVGTAAFKWALDGNSKSHKFVNSVFKRARSYVSKAYPKDRAAAIGGKLKNMRNIYTKSRDHVAKAIHRIDTSWSEGTRNFQKSRYFTGRSATMLDDALFQPRSVKGIKTLSRGALMEKDIRGTSIAWNLKAVSKNPTLKKFRELRLSKAVENTGDMFAKATAEKYKIGRSHAGEAFKSRIFKYAAGVAAGAPFEYGMYRAFNKEKKDAWHSPNAMKGWLQFKLGGDLVFGGAIAKGVGAGVNAFKRNVVLPKTAAPMMSRMLKGLQKVSQSKVVSTLQTTIRDEGEFLRNKGTSPTSVRDIGKWSSNMASAFRKNYHKISRMKPSDRPSLAKSAVDASIESLRRMEIAKDDGQAESLMKGLASQIHIEQNLRKNDPNKLLSKMSWMFKNMGDAPKGAKSVKLQNSMRKFKYSADVTRNPDKSLKEVVMKKVASNSKIPEYFNPAKGVIEFGGKTYDISNISPSNVTKNVVNTLSAFTLFKGTAFELKPFRLLGASPFAEIEGDQFMKRYTAKDNKAAFIGHMKASDDHMALSRAHAASGAAKTKAATKYTIKTDDAIKQMNLRDGGIDDVVDAAKAMESNATGLAGVRSGRSEIDTLQQMRMGHLKLAGNEEVWYLGKRIYYTPNSAKKDGMELFQLGFDFKHGKYDTFDVLLGSKAGGISAMKNEYYGLRHLKKGLNKNTFENASGHTKTDYTSAETWANSRSNISELLDLGQAEKPSIFSAIGHMFRRFGNLTNPRSFFGAEGVMNKAEMVKVAGSRPNDEARHKFLRVTKSHLRKAKQKVVDTFFSRNEYITAVRSNMKKKGIKHVDPDDMLSMFKPNKTNTYTDSVQFIKNDAKRAFGINKDIYSGSPISKTNRYAKYLDNDEIDLINNLFTKNDPTKATVDAVIGSSRKEQVRLLKQYNNIRIKTHLATMRETELDEMMGEISMNTFHGRTRKIENAVNLTKVFNSTDGGASIDELLNNEDLSTISDSLFMKATGAVRNNRQVFESYAKYADPIWKMKGSPFVDPGVSKIPALRDVFISKNRGENGESIRGYFEQFMPSMSELGGVYSPETPLSRGGLAAMGVINAINNTASVVGLGFNPDNMRTPTMFLRNTLTKRILPAMALGAAWKVADTAVDESGLFEGSALGQGINAFAMEQVGKTRLAIARLNDVTGVTDSANYLEKLFPGSISSPLAGAVRGFGTPMLGSALGAAKGGAKGGVLGGMIGIGVSLLSAGGPMAFMGKFDLTKTRTDIIEEYSGRKQIPVHRGAGWLLSSGPFAGQGIEYFKPSAFHMARSQHKNTDVLYGSKTEELINTFNPTHYMKKHKYSRPYPFGGEMGANIPMIGDMVKVGGQVGDYPEMHAANMIEDSGIVDSPAIDKMGLYSTSTNTTSMQGTKPYSGFIGNPDVVNAMEEQPMLPTAMPARMQSAFYGASEFAGLKGFLTQTAITGMNDGMFPFEDVPTYQSASLMASPTRSYWDSIPNDPLGLSEFTRRFVPKRGEHVNELNPLVNAMPMWIPGEDGFKNFQAGDPYVKIRMGEARLPGQGYEALHEVRYTAPLETEYFGMTAGEVISEMTGNAMPTDPDERYDKMLRGRTAKEIASTLSSQNTAVKLNQHVFNPLYNLSGKFDVTVGGNHGMRVKPLTPETFSRLNSARPEDVSEMNALMNISKGTQQGSVIYVDSSSGETKEFRVQKDSNQFQNDLRRTYAAKSASLDLIEKHGPKIGKSLGASYSRADRLAVLADVSPYSDEYKQTLNELTTMDKLGLLADEDKEKIYVATKQRELKRDRFKYSERQFNRGTAVTAEESMKQDSIKKEYNAIERVAGRAWEDATFRDTLLVSKFINNKTSTDIYRNNYVYGNGPIKRWENPYQDFIRPGITSAMNRSSIAQSTTSMATAGLVFGGPIGLGLGAASGAIWGTVHGKETVPQYTKDRSETLKQIDTMTYMKAQENAKLGDIDAQKEMQATMTYAFNNATTNNQLISSLPRTEREFARKFMNAGTAEEREQIMNMVPDYTQYALQKAWAGGKDGTDMVGKTIDPNPMDLVEKPNKDWAGFDPTIQSQDIAVKMLDRSGVEARGAGLGFQAQRRKMLKNPYIPDTFNTKLESTTPDMGKIRSIINSMLPGSQMTIMPTQMPGFKLIVKGSFNNKSEQMRRSKEFYGS